jgi:thiamine transporter ThiT
MSDAVQEYHPGDQEISEQVATFGVFGKMMKWGSLCVAVLLVMLVLWFCRGAGFFGGLIPGLVVLSLGIYFLRSKPEHGH